LVKACLYADATPAPSRSTIIEELWHHLHILFDKSELTEDSLRYLASLAVRLNEPSMSWSLMATCELHGKHDPEQPLLRLGALSQRFHGPRNIEHGFSLSDLNGYLFRLRKTVPESKAVEFFGAVSAAKPKWADQFQ